MATRINTADLQAQINILHVELGEACDKIKALTHMRAADNALLDAHTAEIADLKAKLASAQLRPTYSPRPATQQQLDRDTIRAAAMALAQRLGRSVTRQEAIDSLRG